MGCGEIGRNSSPVLIGLIYFILQSVTLVSALDIYEDDEAELLLSYNCKLNTEFSHNISYSIRKLVNFSLSSYTVRVIHANIHILVSKINIYLDLLSSCSE